MKNYVLKPDMVYEPDAASRGVCRLICMANAANLQRAIRRKYGEDGLQRMLQASRRRSMRQRWAQKRREEQRTGWLLVGGYALIMLVLLVGSVLKVPV